GFQYTDAHPIWTPARILSLPGVERSFPSAGLPQLSLHTSTGAARSETPPIAWVEIDQRSSKWCSTRTPIPSVLQNGSPMEKAKIGWISSIPPMWKSWAVTGGSDAGAPYFGTDATGGRLAGVTWATFVSGGVAGSSAARAWTATSTRADSSPF